LAATDIHVLLCRSANEPLNFKREKANIYHNNQANCFVFLICVARHLHLFSWNFCHALFFKKAIKCLKKTITKRDVVKGSRLSEYKIPKSYSHEQKWMDSSSLIAHVLKRNGSI
jgi:hypothetical protein